MQGVLGAQERVHVCDEGESEMSKHTPGPWGCVRYSKKRFGLGQRGNGAFFLLQCVDDDTDNPAARADARLIAAAPDLLEALELCLDGLITYAPAYMHGIPKHEYIEKARAAIVKAREKE